MLPKGEAPEQAKRRVEEGKSVGKNPRVAAWIVEEKSGKGVRVAPWVITEQKNSLYCSLLGS